MKKRLIWLLIVLMGLFLPANALLVLAQQGESTPGLVIYIDGTYGDWSCHPDRKYCDYYQEFKTGRSGIETTYPGGDLYDEHHVYADQKARVFVRVRTYPSALFYPDLKSFVESDRFDYRRAGVLPITALNFFTDETLITRGGAVDFLGVGETTLKGYPVVYADWGISVPSSSYRHPDWGSTHYFESYTGFYRIMCVMPTKDNREPCAIIDIYAESSVYPPEAVGQNPEKAYVDAAVQDAYKLIDIFRIERQGPGRVDPVIEPGEGDGVPWEVVIGGIGVVALGGTAAALAARARAKRKQERQEEREEETVGYILQLSHNRLEVRADQGAQLEAAVWRVDGQGQYTLAADAQIRLQPPPGIAVRPAQGQGRVACRIEQRDPALSGEHTLRVQAQAGGGGYASDVTLCLEADYHLEFF